MAERRTVGRSTMSVEAAFDLWRDLGAPLRGTGAHRLEVASAQLRDVTMDNRVCPIGPDAGRSVGRQHLPRFRPLFARA